MGRNQVLLIGGGLGLLGLLVASMTPEGQQVAEEGMERGKEAAKGAADAVRQAGAAATALLDDWIPTLLAKTSEHEGTYWSVQRNLDGNGVSYGILQWTQLGGGLYELLAAMAGRDGAAFAATFGPSWAQVLDVCRRRSLSPVDGVVLWDDPWLSRFRAAGRLPQFQEVQRDLAAGTAYMKGAVEIARVLGVASERAMVMFFNRTVHQGAAGALGPAKVLAQWYAGGSERRPSDPKDVLAQYAWRCAAAFRRTTEPPSEWYNSSHTIRWTPRTTELSELKLQDYRVTKVTLPSPVWHATTGSWSLYDLITGRSSDILLDPKLRDQDVDLSAFV